MHLVVGNNYKYESNPLHKVRVLFSSTSLTVRFGFGLSNSSGSFGSFCQKMLVLVRFGFSSVPISTNSHSDVNVFVQDDESFVG